MSDQTSASATSPGTTSSSTSKPRIGDSRPAPNVASSAASDSGDNAANPNPNRRRRRRGGRGRGSGSNSGPNPSGLGNSAVASNPSTNSASTDSGGDSSNPGGGRQQQQRRSQAQAKNKPSEQSKSGESTQEGNSSSGTSASEGTPRRRRRGNRGGAKAKQPSPVTAVTDDQPVELDDETLASRRGRQRNGKAVGRYLMAVHVQPEATQISVLEGRSLIEHQVSRPADDVSQIHGNIYLGRIQNVLPGMEAAFVDIGTPKNAVIYRSDARPGDGSEPSGKSQPKIEEMLRAKQMILCQVTKNPIAHKGARLTQEVSLPGRFVVLVPNSTTYGISKRLPDNERKRLRGILDKVRPKGHGLIVRTASEGITASEIEADVARLAHQWNQIEKLIASSPDRGPALLYREPDIAVRMIREELNTDFRKVVIDDKPLFEEVRDYVRSVSPEMNDRIVYFDPATEPLPLTEKYHIHEQLHKALDRKVWLPSGGSLIIEHTEALTVIDVNTGKNVGQSSLEQTVYLNNLEAAEEVARQLRLRDIGGIIVIDFIDMEVAKNRQAVISTFRAALARDKTRTQVFDISELGLVEMTRKRIGEGLLESFASSCPDCSGRGVIFDKALLPND